MGAYSGFLVRRRFLVLAMCVAAGCVEQPANRGSGSADDPVSADRLFTALPSSHTGVRFVNRLEDTRDLNVFTYRNFYNGGGVAIGDLNGDGLPEIVLTSNQHGSRLYRNEGGFRFRDVTGEAGLERVADWTTGVTFADVNGDGWLDIYICHAGNVEAGRRANALYINDGPTEDGVPTFTERAAEYGIADEGYSTHATFFDYDRDGRLDLYVVNNSFRPVSSFGYRNTRQMRDPFGGDRLYRNVGERFVDVSEAAGIFGSEIAFGLGVAVGDVNRDGWPDLYVSNDFFERDYLYINQRDGTFREQLEHQMPYISYSSMGLDIADIDNDGWLDVYVTDMLPEDNYRLKMMAAFEPWDLYQSNLRNGFHHQFTRNMLHVNNRNGTFTEVGQMAGVARTDWSWSALIADFDLDGRKDIHVTNGIARDLTSQDYLSFLADRETMKSATRGGKVDFMQLIDAMGATELPNYIFRNSGDLTFTNAGAAWGLDMPGFSSGAAYGDLDGDGALDLVVNNLNEEASIYRNNARALLDNHYLQVRLEGEGSNRFGVGAKLRVWSGAQLYFQEQMPSRGFQSSVDYVVTFGLGAAAAADSVIVEWPDGRVSVVRNVAADQCVVVRQSGSTLARAESVAAEPLFRDVTDEVALDYTHQENDFVDFDREPRMPRLLSTQGPFMAVADVNGDGLDDAFIGGAKEQAGRLLIQRRDGSFVASSEPSFEPDRVSEDLGAVFFDADGDGAPDLYVVSGGSEFSDMAPALQDRLYLNDGSGNFRKAHGHLPPMNVSGSLVAVADFDDDGDVDVFVGGRVVPWRYGIDPPSVLLANDGKGRFTDVTNHAAPELAHVGMITDAVWIDVDEDERTDLVVVGDWMPVTIFRNTGSGKLERMTVPGLETSHGWWNRIVAGDFTGDGRTDFIVGNLGLNTRFHASTSEPVTMHVKDFDGNGFVEQVVSVYSAGVSHPLALRDDLVKTLPFIESRYPTFEEYARAAVTDVLTPDELSGAVLRKAHTFETALVKNNDNGTYALVPLPRAAQVAPIYGIFADDLDRDGHTDLLLAGNFDGVKPEIGRMSAGYGLYLRGDGQGTFTPVGAAESGFVVPGEARDIQRLRTRAGDLYVVTRNDDRPLVFRTVQ